MSNGIEMRQNENGSIARLAAQRQLYRNAKKFAALSSALSVWIPFILAVLVEFGPQNSNLQQWAYILPIVCLFFSFYIDRHIEKSKRLAAFIQQQFDTYVFQMPWDDKIFDRCKNIDHEIAKYSGKILNNKKEKNELFDWYSPIVDNKSLLNGIILCQRENICWDEELRRRFKQLSIGVIIVLSIMILGIGINNGESVAKLMYRIAFIFPMIEWLVTAIKKINKDIATLYEIKSELDPTELKDIDKLKGIQRMIFEHRKSCYVIPNYIYTLFKDKDEDIAHRGIEL